VLRALAQNGDIYFQDEASQLVAELLGAQQSERILDLCSAPGGKTTLVADRADGAYIVASDVSLRRLATVASSVSSQELKNVSLLLLNAVQQLPFREETFDRVLVDAPCSGTGTLRHNPEIRWRLKPDDIERLASQQLQLLLNASNVVKVGGRLVYSTCSVEKEENELVVAEFLRRQGRFKPIPLETPFLSSSAAIRTWPHRHGTDGFFVSAFEKNQSEI